MHEHRLRPALALLLVLLTGCGALVGADFGDFHPSQANTTATDPTPADEAGTDDGDGDGDDDGDGDGDASVPSSHHDASTKPDAAKAPDGCTAVTFYEDQDGDGFGATSTATTACTSPGAGWVTQDGDCNDDDADVHPGQTQFFAQGYTVPGTTEVSFDYDCDGHETEASPVVPKSPAALVCGWVFNPPHCDGPNGDTRSNPVAPSYVVASPTRSGEHLDPYCGSTTRWGCPSSDHIGSCSPTTDNASPPVSCH